MIWNRRMWQFLRKLLRIFPCVPSNFFLTKCHGKSMIIFGFWHYKLIKSLEIYANLSINKNVMFIETQSTGQEAVAGTSGEETNEDEVPKPRRYISWRTCTVHVWLWKFPAEKFKIVWSFYVHGDVLSLPDFSAKSLHNVFPLNPNTGSSIWSTK